MSNFVVRGTTTAGTNDGSFAPHRLAEADATLLAASEEDLFTRAATWAVERCDLHALAGTRDAPSRSRWSDSDTTGVGLLGELASFTAGRTGFTDLHESLMAWEDARAVMAREEACGGSPDWKASDDRACHLVRSWVARLGIDTSGPDIPLPPATVDRALADARTLASRWLDNDFGEFGWRTGYDGVPIVFEPVGGNPAVLRLVANPDASEHPAEMARIACEQVNLHFSRGAASLAATAGPVVTAEVDAGDPTTIRLVVQRRVDPPSPNTGLVWKLAWVVDEREPDGGYFTGAWVEP